MNNMELIDVVSKIIGEVLPIGSTHIDDERFNNLQEMCTLVDSLLFKIEEVSKLKENYKFSVKRAG